MILQVAAVLVAVDARAQGFDGQRYVPAAGAAGGLVIERPVVPARTTGSAAVFFDFADDAVVVSDAQTNEILSRPLHSLLVADVMGSLAVGGRFELAAHVPVIAYAVGDPLDGLVTDAPAIGDLRVVPKVTILGSPTADGFRLGAAIPVRFPTGAGARLQGSETFTIEPELLLGVKEGPVRVHGTAGFRARPGVDDAAPIGDEFTWGLGAAFGVLEGRTGLDVLVETQGAVDLDRPGEALTDLPLELLAGLDWRPIRDLSVSVGAGPGLTDGLGTPDYRVVLGVRFSPRAEPAADEPTAGDQDGDRVPDGRDECPKAKEDYDGFRDRDGCPEDDNDDDRVKDDDDECPQVAEEPGGDGDGCPDDGHVRVTGDRIVVDGKILFEFDSDTIDRRSFKLVHEIAAVLKDHPEIHRVYIQGHTDNVGSYAYNDDLSLRRASAVRAALIDRGIEAERLFAKGYGERRPIAPNDTPAGRAQNRRVEFLLKE